MKNKGLPPKKQRKLSPRVLRVVKALEDNPRGVLSTKLRMICGCANLPDVIQLLRKLGHIIECIRVPYITKDGKKTKIGLYRLANKGGAL